MLTEIESTNRKAARVRFINRLWAGKGPDELFPAAVEAGMTMGAADELIARVAQAKQQIELVNRLPRLRKEAGSAQDRQATAQLKLEAETSRLESIAMEASYHASDCRREVIAAEDSAQKLLALYDEGLMPKFAAPDEVTFLAARRLAEAAVYQAHQVRIAAEQERDLCRAAVRRLEDVKQKMPKFLSLTTIYF